MAKIIIIFLLTIVSILTIVTQILLPLFIPKLEFFWFFKNKGKMKQTFTSSLDELDVKVDKVVEEYKTVNNEVDETLNKINKIKNKTKI